MKIDQIFKDLPNVFHTADNILIVGYDADRRDNDRILRQVIQKFCQEILNYIQINDISDAQKYHSFQKFYLVRECN